jgi:hypothetical protein
MALLKGRLLPLAASGYVPRTFLSPLSPFALGGPA